MTEQSFYTSPVSSQLGEVASGLEDGDGERVADKVHTGGGCVAKSILGSRMLRLENKRLCYIVFPVSVAHDLSTRDVAPWRNWKHYTNANYVAKASQDCTL